MPKITQPIQADPNTTTPVAPKEEHTNNFQDGECISKQVLNVFFVIDSSGSMDGVKMGAVNSAIRDIMTQMPEIEKDSADATIKLSAVRFSDDVAWLYSEPKSPADFVWHDLEADGGTALEKAYDTLNDHLLKESKGGIMPDFGGVAPIILLLTDGEPNTKAWKQSLARLQQRGWFKAALKYALAIGIDSDEAMNVLEEFTGDPQTVLKTFDAEELKRIIKVIVVTASKVKSQSASAGGLNGNNVPLQGATNAQAIQQVNNSLQSVADANW
jgi:uncharacterized protein YegL